MLSFISAKFRLGRRKRVLRQLGANISNQVGLGGRKSNPGSNPKKNSGENQLPLPHSNTHNLIMNEAGGSCKSWNHRPSPEGQTTQKVMDLIFQLDTKERRAEAENCREGQGNMYQNGLPR